MTTVELTYRVDRLEDIILELANKVNLCTENINRLSDEMREYKERSERADENFRQKLDRAFARMDKADENLRQQLDQTFARIEQIRISAEKADENLRQQLDRTFARMDQADENLRQQLDRTFARMEQNEQKFQQDLLQIRASAEEENQKLRREAEEENQKLRREAEEENQKLRREAEEENQRLRREAEAENQKLRREAEEEYKKMRQDAEEENQKLRREAEEEYKKMRQDAEEENQKLRREAEADYKKIRQEAEADYKKMRQEMGKLSRKMGTLAEDLVAPGIPRLLKEVVGCTEVPRLIGVRMHLHHKGRSVEYDVVALCGEYLLINETKTKLQESDIQTFIERLKEARVFLPEYANYRVVGALASFYTDISLVLRGARMGIIMIGVGEGMMDVLNDSNFVPRTF